MKIFKKILIANRGEIAVRVIKSAQKLGLPAVAVYSEIDEGALHVRLADEAYCIGKEELSDTYLNVDKIIAVAKEAGCDALHPGYGFLSESPLLVEACKKSGITFVGPHLEAIRLMGNKIEARAFVKKLNIPMTAGITGTPAELLKKAYQIPFPLLVKAAAGGGGKGMRIVHKGDNLKEILESTSREAKSYFGDGTIYIEKYIEEPRHIEIQVLGDNFGNVVHLFERECTIQRRYQKIIEESPSPTLTDEVRQKMGASAVSIAREAKYNSAGTIEFLVDKNLQYYFLEMNTRIQVEHPVTEMVTGVDLVEEQILVAAGNPLRLKQEDLSQKGHAIECRIYAEDPANNFLPSPGKISLYQEPAGAGIRVDPGIAGPCTIRSTFDPMISKLVVWGDNRSIALEKSITALRNYQIHGISTNITYLLYLLQHPALEDNKISTGFCDRHTDEILQNIQTDKTHLGNEIAGMAFLLYNLNTNKIHPIRNVWEALGYWRNLMKIPLVVDGKVLEIRLLKTSKNNFVFKTTDNTYDIFLHSIAENEVEFRTFHHFYKAVVSDGEKGSHFVTIEGINFEVKRTDELIISNEDPMAASSADEGSLFAPMPGKVIKVNVKAGDEVKRGKVLLVVEAMKMENNIVALDDGIIEKVNVKAGERVDTDLQLVNLVVPETVE
ncbi:MAG TPA: biotin/lipoyl-binding protein [Bacteroidetes bacterium]|nr:biotin/lipoyl-binding protein [Bacteroidota bacterium]